MTGFVMAPATCPQCGDERARVFVRHEDDLICSKCRGGVGAVPEVPRELPVASTATPPTQRVPNTSRVASPAFSDRFQQLVDDMFRVDRTPAPVPGPGANRDQHISDQPGVRSQLRRIP